MKGRVLLVHNRLSAAPTSDEYDVITQAEAIGASLQRLGYTTATLGITLDLARGKNEIIAWKPDLIFNIVESLDGDDRFAPAAAALFEALRIPFTGSPSAALAITSHKGAAKKIMAAAGLPTPAWKNVGATGRAPLAFPFMVKSATDHASIGITDASVIQSEVMWEQWKVTHATVAPSACFAETYIDGREFNMSVIALPNGEIEVLPPAEIVFDNFPEGKPHIVGYAAKWDESTFEYTHTRREFTARAEDVLLHEACRVVSRESFSLFSLSGYARVDIRVDAGGNPAILEVNANPCLSPDAGFCAACIEAGIDFDAMVNMILHSAVGRDKSTF